MIDRAPSLHVLGDDVQGRRPSTRLSLSRAGVTGVEKVVRIGTGNQVELFFAELECFVDLGSGQKGAHMSRFEEVVDEAIDEVVLAGALEADQLAATIAERVRERQGARRAEVTLSARYPELKTTPASGLPTQEISTLLGIAVASAGATRRLSGVRVQGITACPCAQELVARRSRARLHEEGYSSEEVDRILEIVPGATHAQRGIGTLWVGSPGTAPAAEPATLRRIVEESMSSETYELMKRTDELEVVEKAHRRPRFVEDCVREMVRMAVAELQHLGAEAFVMARQENLESIHRHDVVAERHGLMGEMALELASDEPVARHVSMEEWLEGAGPLGS